jgi:hypothetical protein
MRCFTLSFLIVAALLMSLPLHAEDKADSGPVPPPPPEMGGKLPIKHDALPPPDSLMNTDHPPGYTLGSDGTVNPGLPAPPPAVGSMMSHGGGGSGHK